MGFFSKLFAGGTKIIDYKNGYYEGEVDADGIRHGQGTRYFDNGDKFVGTFCHGDFVIGTWYFASGNKYVGEVDYRGYFEGKGTYYWKDGCKVVAEFRDNEPYYGTFYWPNGNSCKGHFKNFNLQGECIFYDKEGNAYVEQRKDGRRV